MCGEVGRCSREYQWERKRKGDAPTSNSSADGCGRLETRIPDPRLALEGATGLAMRRGGRQRRGSRESRAAARKQAAVEGVEGVEGVELRAAGARERVGARKAKGW